MSNTLEVEIDRKLFLKKVRMRIRSLPTTLMAFQKLRLRDVYGMPLVNKKI